MNDNAIGLSKHSWQQVSMHMTQDLLQIQPSDRNKNYAHSKTHHDPIQRRTQLDISTLFKHKSPLKSPMRKYQRQIATYFLSSVQ